ncbi:M48 family metalloprotease [Streptomyces oryzae]|uniref:M48 family metalloprotease n=2 Tax=Streptomyces oryzae TaxID=1434886 RepID=A0ABS3X8K6_9ACTN|nr:M48 family metalloprotease [Streptomyces oryzae]
MEFAQRRIHVAAHQRGMDATAVGGLLLYIPHVLCSLVAVLLISLLLGELWFLLLLAWLASGALVFHRPTESVLARWLLRLRYPTPEEHARLEPVWREVTARAGVDGRNYQLWVEDSRDLNAVAAAGHIVGVTSFALHRIPSGQLAAVLAHELGHHVGGHAWSSLLGYWYSLPGHAALRLCRALLRLCGAVLYGVLRAFPFAGLICGIVLLVLFTGLAWATIATLYGLPLLIPAVPYLLAAVGRRSELRADQQAAALGFAPMLAEVLRQSMPVAQPAQGQYGTAALTPASGLPPDQRGTLARLLDTHPPYHVRLHHLRPYLEPRS